MKVDPDKSCDNSPMASSNSPGSASHRNGSSSSFTFPFFSIESLSYGKIPDEPLKFTVLKLDGSSFDIEVTGNRTVAELKNAVEAAFSHLEEDGAMEVSWSHVWGHFCLTYNGKQLLTDSDTIESHGIQDGDKLAFTRQETVSQPVENDESEGEDSDVSNGTGDTVAESKESDEGSIEGDRDGERDENKEEGVGKSRLVYFLRKWFSYSRFRAKEQGWSEMHQEYALVSQEIL